MGKRKNLVGQKYNMLTVIKDLGNDKFGNALWLCKCDCGCETEATTGCLVTGHKKSCGCMLIQTKQRFGKAKHHQTHGESRTSLHRIWDGIKQRCYNPNNHAYHYYGGKGIKMYHEWYDDYLNFSNWAKSHGYINGLTIERLDNNKDYCPDNCIWVPLSVQGINKATTRFIEYNGITKSIADWSRYLGINYGTLHSRIYSGWSIERALTEPINHNNRRTIS